MSDLVQLQPGQPSDEPSADPSAEANHRIANNLSILAGLVRMRATNAVQDPTPLSGHDVGLLLEEVSGRIDTIACLHRRLAGGPRQAAVDLGAYLRDVAEALVSSVCLAGQAKLRLVAEPGCLVPSQTALAVGLVSVELLTNAIKYAHPSGVAGQITVGCRTGPDGMIIVEVSDDGVGLPEGLDPMTSDHLGMRMVQALANRAGATIAFEDTGLGLIVSLRIPKNPALGAPARLARSS